MAHVRTPAPASARHVTVANVSFPFIEEDRSVKFLPLEALSLAASLQAHDHEVDVRDHQLATAALADPADPVHARAFLGGEGSTVIVTTPNDAMPVALLWAERLKQLEPDRTIVMAGQGPRRVASQLAASFPFVDAVIHGPLEATAVRLLDTPRDRWATLPGVACRADGAVRENPADAPAPPLDALPFPAYDRVDLDAYWEVMVVTSQGCPFRCGFCARSGRLDEKSVDRVIAELSHLRHAHGRRRVFFYDQTFTLRKPRVLELCRRLREAGLGDLEWACTGRLDLADGELMDAMAAAGCRMIYFGVESGSDAVLAQIGKRVVRARAERTLLEARCRFSVNAFFIWGFPFEALADFEETTALVESLASDGVAPILYVFSPLAGTPLHRRYAGALRFSPEVWEANWPAHLASAPSRATVQRLIERHPAVFPGFHVCDPHVEEKLRRIRALKLETHFPDA